MPFTKLSILYSLCTSGLGFVSPRTRAMSIPHSVLGYCFAHVPKTSYFPPYPMFKFMLPSFHSADFVLTFYR